MMLGHPECIVAHTIHQLRHGLGLVEHRRQMFVGKSAVIHRDAAIADILHVDMSGEQTVKFRDHAMASRAESPIDSCSILDHHSHRATANTGRSSPKAAGIAAQLPRELSSLNAGTSV